MLNIFHIDLIVQAEGAVRGNGGEEAHGLLFEWLSRVAPAFAEQVHRAPQKPFSLSGPTGPAARRTPDGRRLAAGGAVRLRVSSLTREMHAALQELTQRLPGAICRLGSARLAVTAVRPVHGAEGRSWEDFWTLPPAREITFRFLSPTSFRRQGVQMLFPEPALLFGSLLRRQAAFAACPLPLDWAGSLERLRVTRYALRTEAVPFGRYTIIGSRGVVTYTVPQGDRDLAALASGLARLAPYTGLGYKATMGLGQALVRLGPDEEV